MVRLSLECPDCEIPLKRKRCPRCGWSASPVSVRPVDPLAWRCVWTTNGRRCEMPGTIGNHQSGFRCAWHYNLLSSPRLAEEYEEFTRWITWLVEKPYCSVWTHDAIASLWDAVHGHAPWPDGSQPCKIGSCAHTLDRLGQISAAEALRQIKASVTRIGVVPEHTEVPF